TVLDTFFSHPAAPTETHTLSLHDALPISCHEDQWQELEQLSGCDGCDACLRACPTGAIAEGQFMMRAERCLTQLNEKDTSEPFRSEEHTSELQSRENLVCRLLLEKKNIKK